MKRDIACEECSLKYHGSRANIEGPEEIVKKVRGLALMTYHCDRCGEVIHRGSKCVAISVIVNGQQYYKWENKFISTK